jgi:lipopolysaccharide biosynthesis regulator YciM
MNPYRAIIEWIPYYATANIDGLQKVNESLNKLVDKKLNHIGVDTAITITNGRILQLEGKPEQAIEHYQQLDTKDFMKNSIFTDPLVDCHIKLGDDITASSIANKNSRLVSNRSRFATQTYELTGENQPWMTENISASGVAGIISA